MVCELFAMSSRVETTVSFSLHEFSQHGGKIDAHSDGWGLAVYDGQTAQVHREASAAAFSQKMHYLNTHQQPTRCVISHIRRATVGERALRNTQPFVRDIKGHSHVFAHNGDLPAIENKTILNSCHLEGETDSERAFCYLISALTTLWHTEIPTLKTRVGLVEKAFNELAELGIANFLYADGDYLYVFSNKRHQANGRVEPPGMYFLERECHCDQDALKRAGVDIPCAPQQVLLFASVPLTGESWQPLHPCQLLAAKDGEILYRTP